jgi:hypothetical protein
MYLYIVHFAEISWVWLILLFQFLLLGNQDLVFDKRMVFYIALQLKSSNRML